MMTKWNKNEKKTKFVTNWIEICFNLISMDFLLQRHNFKWSNSWTKKSMAIEQAGIVPLYWSLIRKQHVVLLNTSVIKDTNKFKNNSPARLDSDAVRRWLVDKLPFKTYRHIPFTLNMVPLAPDLFLSTRWHRVASQWNRTHSQTRLRFAYGKAQIGTTIIVRT